MIFESHAHYSDARFEQDRDSLISSLTQNGIGYVIEVMANIEDLAPVRALCEKYPFVYAAAGIHPSDIRELTMDQIEQVRDFSHHEKCVAIGEIGLDYYWDKDNPEQQRYWFEYQAQIAREEGLPVIIHSREAANDTVSIVKENHMEEIGGVMHCFSYTKEIAKVFLDLGFYLGIGGVITFKNARKLVEAVEYAPLESLLLETDCPYLAPEPFRGQRNSSLYLPQVVRSIARIKGVTADEVESATMENARRLFRI